MYELILTSALTIMLHHLMQLWHLKRRRGHKKRRWWVRPINKHKDEHGFEKNFVRDIEMQDHEEFFYNFRMWPEHFNWLLDQVKDRLQKHSRRKPLSPKLRLLVTLLYLAHGDSIISKHTQFRIGRSTVYTIIPETCQAIWETLHPIFLSSMDQYSWEKVADEFFNKWQFPHCLGALDGKHIRIKAPPMSGSQFYNYKGFFSIVLLATCDADYKFTWVDIGQYGSISDGGVWNNTYFKQALEEGTVNLPLPTPLPNDDAAVPFPYVFVGDEAFPLSTYMMRPFPKKNDNLTDDKRIFNYRLSRARRTIENTFGIMGARWQILNCCISCSPKNAEEIVKALVCLHNFMMICGRAQYCPSGFVDVERDNGEIQEGTWRDCQTVFQSLGRVGANRSSRTANGMREYLMQYFVSEIGRQQAPWQYESALRSRFTNV